MIIVYYFARALIALIQSLPLPLVARLGRFGGGLGRDPSGRSLGGRSVIAAFGIAVVIVLRGIGFLLPRLGSLLRRGLFQHN